MEKKGDAQTAEWATAGRTRYIGGANPTDGAAIKMAEDWIARAIAGSAAIGTVANAYFAWARHRREIAGSLPVVEWQVRRDAPRFLTVAFAVTNNGQRTIFVERITPKHPIGAGIYNPTLAGKLGGVRPTEIDRNAPLDLFRRRIDPGGTARFELNLDVAEHAAAPATMKTVLVLRVDLGLSRPHHFKFNRNM